MRLEQMRYLEAIVRCKSFRRAAEELQLAEPSLSQQMRKLEIELGAKILDRPRRSVCLTDFGAAIMPHALAMLQEEQRMRQAADAYHGLRRGQLRFGTVNAGSNTLLPQVLPIFNRRYPGVEVRVTETGSLDITTGVLSGELDIGLIVRVPEIYPVPDGLAAEDLLKSSVIICAPEGHPFARQRRVTIAEVAQQPLIIFRQGYLMHEVLRTLLGDHAANIVYYTDNTESAKRMVAAGVGITLLPEFSIVDDSYRREGRITYVRLDANVLPLRLCVVSRAGGYLSRAASVFRDMLREAASRFSKEYSSNVVTLTRRTT